jgi:nucleoside-diphosphate-sugar epimerase
MGAQAVVADILDRESVLSAVEKANPDVVFHQLTALSDWSFADSARIRAEGTRNLVDAALAAGVRRIVAQSISWAYAPGPAPAKEEEPLDTDAPPLRARTIRGIALLERGAAELPEHVILRYGMLYGPGTRYDRNGAIAERVRLGQMPATDGVVSFLHVEDAALAALLALGWPSGAVNIVDDEPAAGTEWLPVYASALQVPRPQVRRGSNRGERGASNAKAKSEYGWVPLYPSWRSGFAQSLY